MFRLHEEYYGSSLCSFFLMETYTVSDYAHATIRFCCVQSLAALRLTDTAGRIFQECLEEEFRRTYWQVTSAAAIAVRELEDRRKQDEDRCRQDEVSYLYGNGRAVFDRLTDELAIEAHCWVMGHGSWNYDKDVNIPILEQPRNEQTNFKKRYHAIVQNRVYNVDSGEFISIERYNQLQDEIYEDSETELPPTGKQGQRQAAVEHGRQEVVLKDTLGDEGEKVEASVEANRQERERMFASEDENGSSEEPVAEQPLKIRRVGWGGG